MIDLTGRTYLLPLSYVVPPHAVTDPAHRDAIAASMAAEGWQGRPLLVVEGPSGYVALTGSHRYAAARLAGLEEVEAVVVEGDALEASGEEVLSASTGERLTDLRAESTLGDLLRASDPEAYALLSEEP